MFQPSLRQILYKLDWITSEEHCERRDMSRWMHVYGHVEFKDTTLTKGDLDAWIQAAELPRGSEGPLEWEPGVISQWEEYPSIDINGHLRDSGWAEDVAAVEVWFCALDFSGVTYGFIELCRGSMCFIEGLYWLPDGGIEIVRAPEPYFPSGWA